MQRKHVDSPPFCQLKISLSCLVSCQGDIHGSVPSTGHNHLCLVDQTRQSLSRQRDGGPSPIDGREIVVCRQQEEDIHGGHSSCSAVGHHMYVTSLSRQRDAFSFCGAILLHASLSRFLDGTKVSPQKMTFATFSMSHHFGGARSKYADSG